MQYVQYSPAIDRIAEDEQETVAEIRKVLLDLAEKVREKHGTVYKGTHAKAVGLVTGQLTIDAGLPVELAQGLFSSPGRYDVAVRYAPGPPEKLSDKASGQRGMAIKIMGVTGQHLAESDETTTQDFVLAVDPAFLPQQRSLFYRHFATRRPSPPAFRKASSLPHRARRGRWKQYWKPLVRKAPTLNFSAAHPAIPSVTFTIAKPRCAMATTLPR